MIEICFLENYNPKSLIEIAADKTKLAPLENSNSTSTPKIVKKESLKESAPSDFDLDYSIDIGRLRFTFCIELINFFMNILEPHYPRELFQGNKPDFSLSFLTDGLNKLGLDGSGKQDSLANVYFHVAFLVCFMISFFYNFKLLFRNSCRN